MTSRAETGPGTEVPKAKAEGKAKDKAATSPAETVSGTAAPKAKAKGKVTTKVQAKCTAAPEAATSTAVPPTAADAAAIVLKENGDVGALQSSDSSHQDRSARSLQPFTAAQLCMAICV